MLMFRPLLRFADFKGRARRMEYWLFAIFQFFAIALCLGLAIGSLGSDSKEAAIGGLFLGLGLAGLCCLILFIPSLAVLARRLHDTGRSTWWMLLIAPNYLSPMMSMGALAGAAQAAGGDPDAAGAAILAAAGGSALMGGLSMLCNLVLFVLTLLPGTRGPNRFGPDPKDPTASDIASVFGDERMDELIREAKRETRGDYKPVFDFSSDASPQPQPVRVAEVEVEAPRPWTPTNPAMPQGAFGRRAT